MKKGDLVRLEWGQPDDFGLVTWVHPTKGVAQVLWNDIGLSWEKKLRLKIVSTPIVITEENKTQED